MWRTTVLSQALYGCELRNVVLGYSVLSAFRAVDCGQQVTIALSNYGANEVIFGLPLGATAMRDPQLEVLTRQLKWR